MITRQRQAPRDGERLPYLEFGRLDEGRRSPTDLLYTAASNINKIRRIALLLPDTVLHQAVSDCRSTNLDVITAETCYGRYNFYAHQTWYDTVHIKINAKK